MLQIAMFIGGIYVLFKGEVALTKARVVRGWKARVIGGVMALALPLAFCSGLLLGVMAAAGQIDLTNFPVLVIDLGLTFGAALISIVLGFIWGRPAAEWDAEKFAAENSDGPQQFPPRDFSNPYQPPHT